MSETTVERLKRLNSSANERAPLEVSDVFWTAIANGIDEAFGDGVPAMSDFEIGFIVGGAVGRMMKYEKESK
jgi:hypothetical protein